MGVDAVWSVKSGYGCGRVVQQYSTVPPGQCTLSYPGRSLSGAVLKFSKVFAENC